jgi:hypothetical protein
VDMRDVRMVQRREDFGFTLEAGEPLRIRGQRSWQHLDGDLALQVDVGGAIDLSHAACAESGEDLIRAEARAGSQRQGRQVGRILARTGREPGLLMSGRQVLTDQREER